MRKKAHVECFCYSQAWYALQGDRIVTENSLAPSLSLTKSEACVENLSL